jgi:hypothetical protein
MNREYAIRLYDIDGQIIREKLYIQTKKEARQVLKDMREETPEAVAFGIDEM